MTTDLVPPPIKNSVLAERLAASARLVQRRFENLPLVGPGAVFSNVQVRTPGDATTYEKLVGLMRSIGSIGLLQPILVEELPKGEKRVVAGERRVRACRLGLVQEPDNSHFHQIPAIICPGPLTADERITWQLVENLSREDLGLAELATALIFERCAVVALRLSDVGAPPPPEMLDIPEPIERWNAINKFRVDSGNRNVGAPWSAVLERLGLHLSSDKVEQIVRAFARIPAAIADEMDEEKVRLNTRLAFARLANGREAAADELWRAVRDRGQANLLPTATRIVTDHPEVSIDDALQLAGEQERDANLARAATLRGYSEPDDDTDREGDEFDDADGSERSAPGPSEPISRTLPSSETKPLLSAMATVMNHLRAGMHLGQYDIGSLKLYLVEIAPYLGLETVEAAEAEAS